MQPETLDTFLLRKVYVVPLFMWTGGQVSLRLVNVMWTELDSLDFTLHFVIHFDTASRLVCSVCEGKPGSLSVANTAVSAANAAVVDSVEVGRSPGYCLAVHKL
jgi:hypothetical protein